MFKEFLRKKLSPRTFNNLVQLKNFFFPSSNYTANRKQLRKAAKFYSLFIKEYDLVFDIGANYGGKVKVFSQLKAQIVAVEPQAECIHYLRSLYGSKLILVEKGVADKEGTIDFFVAESSTLSTFSRHWAEDVVKDYEGAPLTNAPIKVPVTTLDKLVEEFGRPVFIKIDVEGFEFEVLKGLTQPVNYLSFEYAVPENRESLILCVQRILHLGKARFNYSSGESMELGLDQWKTGDQFLLVINSPAFIATSAGDVYVHFEKEEL
jgi:FkbM family methyltransferase